MSGWIEVMVRGDCRAYLDASHIKGVMTKAGLGPDELASPESPISLIVGSGETLDGVYGISVSRLLFRMYAIREYMRQTGRHHLVVYLDSGEAFDTQMASAVGGSGRGEGG